jgi:hypothetical protein
LKAQTIVCQTKCKKYNFSHFKVFFESESVEKIMFWRETIIQRKMGMILVSHIKIKITALKFATKRVLPQLSAATIKLTGAE